MTNQQRFIRIFFLHVMLTAMSVGLWKPTETMFGGLNASGDQPSDVRIFLITEHILKAPLLTILDVVHLNINPPLLYWLVPVNSAIVALIVSGVWTYFATRVIIRGDLKKRG